MSERFQQKQIPLKTQQSKGVIKVSQLLNLVEDHPYLEKIKKVFKTESIKNDLIVVENADLVYKHIARIKEEYVYFNIKVHSKDVRFSRGKDKVDGIREEKPVIFNFNEYVDYEGEVHKNMDAYALYDSRGRFFEDFSMSKYSTMLFDNKLDRLAELNLDYFRRMAETKSDFDKYQSYRIVENKDQKFVRGITSLQYKEYGVDFAFVITMLMLHKYMRKDKGNNYKITFAALNESKLEMIITSGQAKEAGDFGTIRSAISVKTNDLGAGALTFTNIVKLDVKGDGIYLYPKNREVAKKDLTINHGNTSPQKAMEMVTNADDFYGYIDLFIEDLKSIKTIKNPEELRQRIQLKIEHPKSSLRTISDLRDLFKPKISDQIKDFAKLLEMCRKAEELDIEYDLKEKLRVVISDILLNKN
jgi:hypothetical protein